MSIASEITRLQSAKASIKSSLHAKGVTVGKETLDEYADLIDSIQTGGGSGSDDFTKRVIEGTLSGAVTFPNGIIKIKNNLCDYNTDISSVVFPNTLTSIGDEAFRACNRLTSVVFPNTLTSIGNQAFFLTGVNNIEFPPSLFSIGYEAFLSTPWYNNQSNGIVYAGKVFYKYKGTMPANTSITLNEDTKGIASYAFSGCSGLTSIVIPSSVLKIGNNAFNNCTGLTSIVIPSSVHTLDAYSFYGCSSLSSISISNGISIINEQTFRNCKSLTSVEIPSSVTYIGSNAFNGCSSLETVVIRGSSVILYLNTVFGGTSSSIKFYVPFSADHSVLNWYKTNTHWKTYAAKIFELNEDGSVPSE